MDVSGFEKIRVLVETTERTFRGYVHKPISDTDNRLSDYLNQYGRLFLCLSDVAVNERGQTHRPAERRDFVAVSTAAITYVTPMREGES